MQKFCKSIIAFEPDGINFECLHKNLAPFNHITCNQNAIGEIISCFNHLGIAMLKINDANDFFKNNKILKTEFASLKIIY